LEKENVTIDLSKDDDIVVVRKTDAEEIGKIAEETGKIAEEIGKKDDKIVIGKSRPRQPSIKKRIVALTAYGIGRYQEMIENSTAIHQEYVIPMISPALWTDCNCKGPFCSGKNCFRVPGWKKETTCSFDRAVAEPILSFLPKKPEFVRLQILWLFAAIHKEIPTITSSKIRSQQKVEYLSLWLWLGNHFNEETEQYRSSFTKFEKWVRAGLDEFSGNKEPAPSSEPFSSSSLKSYLSSFLPTTLSLKRQLPASFEQSTQAVKKKVIDVEQQDEENKKRNALVALRKSLEQTQKDLLASCMNSNHEEMEKFRQAMIRLSDQYAELFVEISVERRLIDELGDLMSQVPDAAQSAVRNKLFAMVVKK